MFERVPSLFPTCESEQNRKEAKYEVFNLKIGNRPAGIERSYTTVTAEPLSGYDRPLQHQPSFVLLNTLFTFENYHGVLKLFQG